MVTYLYKNMPSIVRVFSARYTLVVLVWILTSRHTGSNATRSDIDCLKSIHESLEDPFQYLTHSWNFNNNSEGFICKFAGIECWHPDENKVLNIRLADMGLKGEFPRGLENCKALTGLDLSGNLLFGPIPSDIDQILQFVAHLDLSGNDFSGEIPLGLANMSYLNSLILDNNQLTGQIPPQLGLLSRIKTFGVSNNKLSGPVPVFQGLFISPDSYAHNPGLCGDLLGKHCKASHPNDHAYTICGFAVGWTIFTVLTIYLIMLLGILSASKIRMMIKKLKMKQRVQPQSESSKEMDQKIAKLERFVTRMSFTELAKAADNYNGAYIIGMGKAGLMYKAMLPNGWFLAIKRLHAAQHLEKHFLSELIILGRLRHNNLMPIIGFCSEMNNRLLVYKYMSNGNLYDCLHRNAEILKWPLRAKIIVGIARGLAWLHHSNKFRVIHQNLSSKCVLLDKNFEPKISNFGEARVIRPDNSASVRNFFINAEFWELGFIKKDVFSFGVIILELITGKEPSEVINSSKSFVGYLIEWIKHPLSSSAGLYEVMDQTLIWQGCESEISSFLQIASDCLKPFPHKRPTMQEVYKDLKAITEKGVQRSGFGCIHD